MNETNMTHLYVNGSMNASVDNQIAQIDIFRNEPIYDNVQSAKVSVERFTGEFFMPLFDASTGGSITIIEIASGNESTVAVDWTPKAVDGFIYNYRHVAEAVSTAFETASNNLGIPAPDQPTFEYNEVGSTFSIKSKIAEFQDLYDIEFDSDMYRYFNSFDYETQFDKYLLLLNETTETQRTKTLEYLSPVTRVVINTNISVISELLPPPNDANAINNFTQSFLVDYSYFQPDGNPMQYIYFSASDSDHRWHDMRGSQGPHHLGLIFYWYDKHNVARLLRMKKECNLTAKLFFLLEN